MGSGINNYTWADTPAISMITPDSTHLSRQSICCRLLNEPVLTSMVLEKTWQWTSIVATKGASPHLKLITLAASHVNWLLAMQGTVVPPQEDAPSSDLIEFWTSEIFLAKFSTVHILHGVASVIANWNGAESKIPISSGELLIWFTQLITVATTQ